MNPLRRLRSFLGGLSAFTVAAIGLGSVVVVMVALLLYFEGQHASDQLRTKDQQITVRDQTIAGLNNKLFLVGNAYAALRDQEFSLGITPAAGSLTQVENPGTPSAKQVTPKSFTVAIPDPQAKGGVVYFTCTDKTGAGNFVCSPPATPPSAG